ncbi:MAG: GTP 3',8-cyclase MoaA [bacterium]|nr:GTP 3',8-cyclase MoaA [bacterium]
MKLQDSIGRTITSLRVSVTDRCNLRCQYCMPEEGVEFLNHAEILRYEEMERIIRVALALGVSKVRLTGGEPLVRKGLIDFIRRLKTLAGLQTLTMTTNGILLDQYAEDLWQAGLSYLNISLDTLNAEKFRSITRFNHLDTVLKGIEKAGNAGFSLIKVNVVSVRGFNDDEVFDFVEFANDYGLVVRFIEYMPFPGNGWEQKGFLPSKELRTKIQERYTLVPRYDNPSAAAKSYYIPGHNGSLGFISAASESFCDRCNRLRLTSDGFLRPCLHGPIEIDLKSHLRRGANDTELMALFHEAVEKKPDSHQDFFEDDYQPSGCEREMVKIGG